MLTTTRTAIALALGVLLGLGGSSLIARAGTSAPTPSRAAATSVPPAVARTHAAPPVAPPPVAVQPSTLPNGRDVQSGVAVRRFVLASGVVDREPVGAAARFDGSQPIVAFLDLRNDGAPTHVEVTFEAHGSGRRTGFVTLEVPTRARHRTWATTRLATRPGTWDAVVRGADGHELGRATFHVDPGDRS